MPRTTTDTALTIVPANEASWDDLQAIFGMSSSTGGGSAASCQCQRFKMNGRDWDFHMRWVPVEERADLLREQTGCGHPGSRATSGLVAYLEGEPVGWCAVEPRTVYIGLLTSRVVWPGRSEDKNDPGVWAATCFVVRAGFRRQGLSYALAHAAVEFARERGARVLEGYPMITESGKEITWGELHVGSRSIFEAAGFTEVSRPTLRRVVMRSDF